MPAEDYIKHVNEGLKSLLDSKINWSKNPDIKLLIKQQSAVVAGGSRLRPRLLFVGYQAFGGRHPQKIVSLGVYLELLHQALLVHDDLIDQDIYRRGQLNVMGQRQSKPQAAYASGLLVGDLLLNWVFELIVNDPLLTNDQKLAITKILTRYLDLTIKGQVLDALKTDDLRVTLSELDKINELKSASYSTNLPLAIAAQLLGLSKSKMTDIDSFASSLGRYMQINNDIEDYLLPKARLSDYQMGKVTIPYLKLLSTAPHVHKHLLAKTFGQKLSPAQCQDVRQVAHQVLTSEVLSELSANYYQKVINDLNKLKLATAARSDFVEIIDSLNTLAVSTSNKN